MSLKSELKEELVYESPQDPFKEVEDLSGKNTPQGKSSISYATFNLAKMIVGAGIFGLPKSFQTTGFITVFLLICSISALIYWTILVLLNAGIKLNELSYDGLMKKCFGVFGARLYSFFAFMIAFGGMAAYTVIVGDTVPIVLRSLFGIAEEGSIMSGPISFITDRRIVIIISSVFVMLPVSSFRDISRLARFSFMGLVFVVLIAFLVLIAGLNLEPHKLGDQSSLLTVYKKEGISGAIGTICFAFVCHHNTFIIFKSLKNPTISKFKKVDLYSLVLACGASLFIGICGYMLFNGKITSNILNVFDNTNPVINFARFLFALDMFLTYPLQLFVARNTLFRIFYPETFHRVSLFIHMVFTITLVTATTLIGIFTCDLGVVFDITGGLAASVIAFIFPSLCFLRSDQILSAENRAARPYQLLTLRNLPHILTIFFGLFVMGFTTYTTVLELFVPSPAVQCKFLNF